jgi:hypothetical protein
VQIGRQGDAGGLEDAANLAGDSGAGGDALAVFFDRGVLETVEIAQQVGPFDDEAVALAQIGQLLLQRQGEERAEHMAADGGIRGVVDRAGSEDRFGTAEQVFDLQQIAVAQHGLQRRDPGIGAQHEETVVAGLVGELSGIDLKGRAGLAVGGRHPTQVAAVGGITDQRLIAARQLLGEPCDDRLPLVAVAFRFGLVAADGSVQHQP